MYADLNVQRYNLAEIKIWKPHRSTIAFGLTVLVVNEEIAFLTQNSPILITSTYIVPRPQNVAAGTIVSST